MGWDYSEKVKEHFFNPKNVGRVDDPDGVGEVGSVACGDALTLTLKVNEDDGTIEDAKFQTFGCGSAIASSSMLTELVKGKTLDEALVISNQDIAAALGGLPAEKMHCSVMGREALEAAIADYRGEQSAVEEDEDEGKIICHCFGITEGKLRRVVTEDKLRTVEDVTNYTKAGGGCGSCLDEIENILDEINGADPAAKPVPKPAEKPLTNLERIGLIQELLDNEIRPMLQKDGGDVELVDIKDTLVYCRLKGACAGCKGAGQTLKMMIEKTLKDQVDERIRVIEV